MSEAAQKVNSLLATDVQDEANVVSQLLDIYDDFQCTRSLIYPQKDLLAYLVSCLKRPAGISEIHCLAAVLLTQFCEPPRGCDAGKIRGWLVELGLIEVLCDFLGNVKFATGFQRSVPETVGALRVEQLERSTALLLAMAGSMLPAKQQLVMSELIRVLCQLCLPSIRFGRMFDYPTRGTLQMQKLMLDNKLYASSITFSEPTTSTELFGLLFGFRRLCSEHAFVDVMLACETGFREPNSLADQLVEMASFWPRQKCPAKCCKSASETGVGQALDLSFDSQKDSPREAWNLLELGDVVGGCHFFARLIDPAITNKLCTIESIMCDTRHERLIELPAVGDMVSCIGPRPKRRAQLATELTPSALTGLSNHIYANGSSSSNGDGCDSIYYRGQILRTVSVSEYEVLAIDYGHVVMVSSEQLYKECTALLHVKPDAVLCTLRGVGSVPVSNTALSNIIDTLRIIAKGRPAIGRRIVQGSMFTRMLKLLDCCPLPSITAKAALLLAELARDGQLRAHLRPAVFGTNQANFSLMGSAKRFFEKGWIKAASAAFSALANMLICDEVTETADVRVPFSSLKNADMKWLLGIITSGDVAESICDASPGDRAEVLAVMLQCMRNYIGCHVSSHTHLEEDSPLVSAASSRATGLLGSRSCEDFTRANSLLTTSRSSPAFLTSESCEKPAVKVSVRSSSNAACSLPSPDASGRSAIGVDRRKSSPPCTCRTASTSAGMLSQVCEKTASPSTDPKLLPDILLSNPSLAMTQAASYVLGSNFPYSQDNQHEILDGRFLTELGGKEIAMHLNAFSNSVSGGSLFIGVSGGKVCGINVARGQRDSFRLRMNTLNPFDKPCNPDTFRTSFCAVHHSETESPIPDTYVIELSVKPSIFDSFCKYMRSGKAYVRKCNRTVQAKAHDMRELAVSRAVKRLHIASRYVEKRRSCVDSDFLADERARLLVERRS